MYTLIVFGTKDVSSQEEVDAMRAEVMQAAQMLARDLLDAGHHTLGANLNGVQVDLPTTSEGINP